MAIDLAKMAHENSVDEIVSWVRSTMGNLVATRGTDLVHVADIAKELVEYVKRRRSSRGTLSGVPCGLRDIDGLTDGFQPGDLIVLCTDAVAQWALRSEESGRPPSWEDYWNMPERTWEEEILALRAARELRHDDTTLLLIRVGEPA